MSRRYFFIFSLVLLSQRVSATEINGIVLDGKTKEPLIGASIFIKETKTGVSVSLSGSYKLIISKAGSYTLICSFIGYQTKEKIVIIKNQEKEQVDFELEENTNLLNEIVVTGVLERTSEQFAIYTEKNSPSIVNVMSAKTIELMPDITVANILQRFSGVSVDRNSSGDAQYAIIRGMDQRYNYTLVNGIKIPSPDNKNRYVPMDLFPSDLLDRLEVIKSLTPSMEGDATGGVMNLVMKDAPAKFTALANVASGSNTLALQRGFSTFAGWQDMAPAQRNGLDYVATSSDFSYRNFDYYNVQPINQIYGFSIGDRLTKNKRLGAVFAGSYQNLYRSTSTTYFAPNVQAGPDNLPYFDDILIRQYSNHQNRLGLHLKADYQIDKKNSLKLYSMFVELDEVQRRHTADTSLSIGRNGPGTGNTYLLDRSRVQQQQIFNVTLQGDHSLSTFLKMNWSGVYSKANNVVPDWSEFQTSQQVGYDISGKQVVLTPQALYNFKRFWLANSDRDYTGYLNFIFEKRLGAADIEWSTGGLFRDKERNNTYFTYNLIPTTVAGRPPAFLNGVDQINPSQWQFYGPGAAQGGASNPNTYIAHEQIGAAYLQAKILLKGKYEFIGGVRLEHTRQDYLLTTEPPEYPGRVGNKSYLDILPSLNFKYKMTASENLRVSYFKSINRPGFFDLVPSQIKGEVFNESGNPFVRHAIIDNMDIRLERFSRALDQVLIGVFYKYITDPIELSWGKDSVSNSTSSAAISPRNLGNARNFGLELAITKYWGNFGISGNYTYTNSAITTNKLYYYANNTQGVVKQTRPLQGQADHIANFSLLYKNVDAGINLQLASVYTGNRITFVSNYQDLDYWQKPIFTMDFSFEKSFLKYFSFYIKIQNILNSPFISYIKHENVYLTGPNALPDQAERSNIQVQREYYGQNFLTGIRYKFSKP